MDFNLFSAFYIDAHTKLNIYANKLIRPIYIN